MDFSVSYLNFVLLSILAIYIWETYLSLRQRKKLQHTTPSKVLLDLKLTTNKDFQKSQAYNLDKNTFSFICNAKDTIITCLLLLSTLGYKYQWYLANECMIKIFTNNNIIIHSLIFVLINNVFSTIINVPFSMYNVFVIEQNHGFNKQTIGIFFMDIMKHLTIASVITCILIPCMLYIIDIFDDQFVFYLWLFFSVFLLIMIWIAPHVIFPLFNTYDILTEEYLEKRFKKMKEEKNEKMKENENENEIQNESSIIEFANLDLIQSLTNLSSNLNFPLKKIYIIDGSKRSNHSNAYQYGFCNNKYIVIYDTLLNQATTKEITSIMAHELGHWKHWHTLKGLAITEIQIFIIFSMFSYFYRNSSFYESFGFYDDDAPVIIGLLLYFHFLSIISCLMGFLQNSLTRKFEYEADAFAVGLGFGDGLYSGLVTIFRENKATLDPDPLYSAYHHSHPAALSRLACIQKVGKNGKKD